MDQRLEQLRAQVRRTSADVTHIIRAPIDRKITGLQARVGEQSVSGMPLGVILPEDSLLIAEVYLPSRAIGFVETGQLVNIQYDAFPYQKFGIAYGEISQVASTAQLPREIGVASPTGETIYRVSISLEEQSISAFARRVPLQAGMELTADLMLENRRLIEWLLEPFVSYKK
ncbi:MAG: HlyD family efflux transporter periplasmic adaptor subunit [Pseudomonadota bacterium]